MSEAIWQPIAGVECRDAIHGVRPNLLRMFANACEGGIALIPWRMTKLRKQRIGGRFQLRLAKSPILTAF
ncbi:MAG TPA: hypothetical protein VHV47_15835 [Opitutaceae bacterium]|jgi:hypothetical protein|nr:hypothetical protein [Opitutaceae bacterium]